MGAWQLDFDRLLEGEQEVEPRRAGPQGDLRISEVVRGNLEATDSITLKCDVEGRSTIIFLAEEGVMLEAGDLVCELDVSQLEDELVRQEIEVKNAEAAFTKAKEQYEIQVIQNESDIARRSWPSSSPSSTSPSTWATRRRARPASGSTSSPVPRRPSPCARRTSHVRSRPSTRASSSSARASCSAATRDGPAREEACEDPAEKQAERDLALKLKYGNRRRLAELSADVATKRRDVDKTRKQAAARLTDFEAARDSSEYTLERERTQLAELRSQVSKSKIFAPEAGPMVYARERSRWGSGDAIEEGDEVRERQDIAMTIRGSAG